MAQTEKEPQLTIIGSVHNVFTGYGEGDAWVSVLSERGDTIVARCLVITYANRPRHGNEFYFQVPRRPGRYRLHVECKGYKPLDYWYEVKHPGRNASLRMPDLLIQRDFSQQPEPADSLREYQLREATVSATQIKMYYKGDTLVYNAAAFKLPDGSMLDDLIRQLPGAELNEQGEIRINGRKLNYLLLNGKEFFSGNNRVMLDKGMIAPWSGGLSTTVSWKGLQLDVQFIGMFDRYMGNNDLYFVQNPAFATQGNQSTAMLNMWTHPGQVTNIAAANCQRQLDTSLFEDASFVRLKFLQLSYSLPQDWLNATKIVKGAKVYFIGRNLLTFTGYHGYDPEVDSYATLGNYPNTRQYSFGIQLTL